MIVFAIYHQAISAKVERKMRVFSKNAYFSINYNDNIIDIYKKTAGKKLSSIRKKTINYEKNDSLKKEIDSFVDCIKLKKSPIVSSNDGINALKYALEISKKIKR